MPIDIRVAGDPASCTDCANSLAAVASGAEQQAHSFFDARDRSESQWHSKTGDEFRDRVGAMGTGTIDVADRAGELSKAIRVFADDLGTVQARMRQASEVAAVGGLAVTAESIGDPVDEGAVGDDPARDELRARQTAAYQAALQLAEEAREIERSAHSVLNQTVEGTKMLVDDAKKQWQWLTAGAVTGYIGTVVEQADSWGVTAATRAAQLDTIRTVAAEAALSGDPFREAQAARALGVFEKSAEAAERAAAANSKLVLGMTDNAFSQAMAKTLTGPGASTLSKVGSKVPYVGVFLTGMQTVADVHAAKDGGEVAKAVGKDVGGFVAGSAATSLILASASGGPVTLLAVGAGLGVAFGVGAVIDHWDGISDGAGAVGRWVSGVFE
ncbi:hypothetical protein FK531_20365 [Rhodococcus spelaei]|uniref:Uncharacterized protein n=1 Tax=Rhodococcus spelaei TaxID=2546320 RepID=A0A541B0E5_9NOCA|nr:hypothetical protein [Rhodococcus spelaei]TQF65786.1 hypothetical protein FK531_20365 [Rhodococcus spelaei]